MSVENFDAPNFKKNKQVFIFMRVWKLEVHRKNLTSLLCTWTLKVFPTFNIKKNVAKIKSTSNQKKVSIGELLILIYYDVTVCNLNFKEMQNEFYSLFLQQIYCYSIFNGCRIKIWFHINPIESLWWRLLLFFTSTPSSRQLFQMINEPESFINCAMLSLKLILLSFA